MSARALFRRALARPFRGFCRSTARTQPRKDRTWHTQKYGHRRMDARGRITSRCSRKVSFQLPEESQHALANSYTKAKLDSKILAEQRFLVNSVSTHHPLFRSKISMTDHPDIR